MAVIDYKWESVTYGSIATGIGLGMAKFAIIEGASFFIPGAGAPVKTVKVVQNIMAIKSVANDVLIKEIDGNFCHAINRARQAGKMLAIALALGHPFGSNSVSLVGFSLGAQVIKSCLKTLHRIGAHEIIHNVTLLGGATHFEREVELWERILSQTVAGKIKNAYSRRDFILGFYYAS